MKSRYLGLQTSFFIKPFQPQAKRSLTVPSFKALAVLFSDLQNSGYAKQHKVALPLLLNYFLTCVQHLMRVLFPIKPIFNGFWPHARVLNC